MGNEEEATVDFSGVAAEDPAESVEHEHEVVEEIAAEDASPADESHVTGAPDAAPSLPAPFPAGPAL